MLFLAVIPRWCGRLETPQKTRQRITASFTAGAADEKENADMKGDV